MSSNVSRGPVLSRQGSLDLCAPGNPSKKGLWRRYSLNNSKRCRSSESSDGTPQKGLGQLNRTYSNCLVDYNDPQRTTVALGKQDNETYGFEVQTYGLRHKYTNEVEMCTYVSSVQKNGAAETAGLTVGKVILTVNGVCIKGLSHNNIIELIRNSVNLLKMETGSGIVVKIIELEKKMSMLKQTLHEKLFELKALNLQEDRLTRGNLNVSSLHPSMDSLMSLSSPRGRHGRRFSSDSSCMSVFTDDGEDVSPAVFEDASPTEPYIDFFQADGVPSKTLARTRSISSGSSGCQSPPWEMDRASSSSSSAFATLPRRGRKTSMRKQLLKFVPGLSHSVEEEEAV
ncbi:cytohesin-interacting protein [Brachyhypopomus gauderio]|uniref:cytohesin-interacting protein n=1 Tax=Brachyhypopomus gauderio TaxID=698409 RepID=UPI0040423F85